MLMRLQNACNDAKLEKRPQLPGPREHGQVVAEAPEMTKTQ